MTSRDARFITRFAPSPTGRLHLGHAFSALAAYGAARAAGGRFLLRIEDIDQGRCRPEFIGGIYEDLGWLGLEWEVPVRLQSEHMADYRALLDRLDAMGLLYPCVCTRREIAAEIARAPSAPHGPDGSVYPGICKRRPPARLQAALAAGEPYALRLDMARALKRLEGQSLGFEDETHGHIEARPEPFGDIVLARKDMPTSYHLSVVHDDALQGISHVIRGEDLLAATHVHRLLQALLGLPAPLYSHHPLLTDAAGKRLAKRDRAETLRALRQSGVTAAAVRERLGFAA